MFAEVGPASESGEESFQFTVCTPVWFAQNMNGDFVLGRHFLFVKEYDYEALRNFVSSYCSRCVGASWLEIAEKISRLGYWEFEDYVPYSADR